MTGSVQYGLGDQDDIGLIQPRHRVPQVQRDPISDARGDPQDLRFAVRTRQPPRPKRRHHRRPVDERHRRAVGDALAGLDELANEITTQQPANMADQQPDSRLSAVQTPSVRPQPGRYFIEVRSVPGNPSRRFHTPG
jgi:hypothetical protein